MSILSSAFHGLFGGGAPTDSQPATTGPRWWDYGFGLLGGNAPSAVNQVWKERAAADQDRALTNQLLTQAFNISGGQTPGGLAMSGGGTSGAPTQATRAAGGGVVIGGQPSAAAGGGSSASAGTSALASSSGNIIYNPDGSLKSIHQLHADPRFVALQGNPRAAAILKTWEDAAVARAPKWQITDGQQFNMNSDDPSATSSRIGTTVDKDTGMWVDAQGVAHQAQGFNPLIAGVTGTKQRAQTDATNQSNLQYLPQIEGAKQDATNQSNLRYAPEIASRTTTATEAAKAPYDLATVQGPNGPVTGSRASILGNMNGGLIQGRSDGTLNAMRTDTEADNTDIRAYQQTNELINKNLDLLGRGGLELGPIQNAWHSLEAKTGLANRIGDPQAGNFANFRGDVQSIINNTINLAKGTQTDNDAQRAAKAIMDNINDESVVRARLQELQRLGQRAIEERQQQIRDRSATIVQPLGGVSAPTNISMDALVAERQRRAAGR